MHAMLEMFERCWSILGYIFSHSLVTVLGKTASMWHRDECEAFISVFSFMTMYYSASSE